MKARALSRLTQGKLPNDVLFAALRGGRADPSVRQGAGVGLDAAVLQVGGEALVAAADPITFAGGDAGQLAVAVNANDIYALGAEPRWLLATVLAPPNSLVEEVAGLIRELREACEAAGASLVGGHTEVTDAVARTVVACTMLGTAPPAEIIPSDGAQVGDVIIQAGAAAVEGTAILGHPQLLHTPGISIANAARALRVVDGVHALHDVTEGGIATAALELTAAAGCSVELRAEAIVWLPETLAVCADRGLDPLGLLGSGTLLAAVSPAAADAALAALAAAAVPAAVIGAVRPPSPATLIIDGRAVPLPVFARDEALRTLADD